MTTARRHHTQEEINSIALWLQQKVLENLCLVKKWRIGDIAFHGGTSLRLLHDSPRFSEDLDFMIHPEVRLQPLMKRLHNNLETLVKQTFGPETVLGFKMRADEKNPLMYRFTVERPERLGNVVVKVEFFVTPEVGQYNARALPSRPVLKYVDSIALEVAPFNFPAGTVSQIFWDKLYAIAHRPYVKQRDIFDITWLQQYPECPQPDYADLTLNLAQLNQVYGNTTTPLAFLQHLSDRRALYLTESFKQGFTAEMARWLPAAYVSPELLEGRLTAMVTLLDAWLTLSMEAVANSQDAEPVVPGTDVGLEA